MASSSSSKIIKTSSTATKVSPLYPGELGFSYKSKTLFIGPEIGDPRDVITLLSLDNSISPTSNPSSVIIQDIPGDIVDKVPSARAVAEGLSMKASLVGGNEFTGSNLVPDVDIINTPFTLGKLIVNINSIKHYTDYRLQNVPKSERFIFDTPSNKWVVNHSHATLHYTISIYNSQGQKIIAPVETISDSQIEIYLSFNEIGYADLVFIT